MKEVKLKIKGFLFGICLVMFGYCLVTAVRDIYPCIREQRVNRQLARQAESARQKARFLMAEAESAQNPDKDTKQNLPKEPLPQYAELYRQNPDLAGWLRIDGTGIDYPVMYTPGEPEYYLHRDYYGRSAYSGCLFIGEGYQTQGSNTVIYGHHMKDGSMFAGLLSYESQEFADNHPDIFFDTVFEEGVYQVVAAFYCDLDASGEDKFDYYKYLDLGDEQVFNDYISQVEARNVIDTNIRFQYGDRIITLSTCSYHVTNGRFIVAAKKVE